MSKQVGIFVCGVQEGGTTSLHAYFKKHPGLSAPSRKETHFFSQDGTGSTKPNYKKFEAWCSDRDGDRVRFDITPIYCFWPPSFARIQAYNPGAKRGPGFRGGGVEGSAGGFSGAYRA